MIKRVLTLRRILHLPRRKSRVSGSHLVRLELLEPRLELATFTVANNADASEGTLREAILLANQKAKFHPID